MALLHKKKKSQTNATKSRHAGLSCMHWSYSKGGNWTLCTLVTFGGHVALPIETWSSCAHGHMMMGTREEGTFTGRRDFSISDWWNRNPASRMLLNPALDFVGLFFSVVFLSNIKVEGWRKKQLVFPFSFVRRSQKPVWIPSWRWRGLTMLFLVASGRLSFVNLLWPLYYLVCIILTAN